MASLSIAHAATPTLTLTNITEARQHLTPTTPTAKLALPAAHKAPHKAPAGEWTSVGTGAFSDNLFNLFGAGNATWSVEIEQSATNPAWYRLAPLTADASTAISVAGEPDPTAYMYVDTTDPANVKFDDFSCYGGALVYTQRYTKKYGTLADNTITFPQKSIVMEYNSGAYYANSNGPVTIYLPGADVKDYSMEIGHDTYCTPDNKHVVNFTTGADIATVKLMIMPGSWAVSTSASNASYVGKNGQAFNPTGGALAINVNASAYAPGIYSVMAVGLDATGAVQAAKEVTFIVADNAASGWKTLGTTTYNEMLYAGSYNDVAFDPIKVTVMESTTTPGRYCLVDPYDNFAFNSGSPLSSAAHDHIHGIIINANNPAQVYIEPSPIGYVTPQYGQAAAFSLAGEYLSRGLSADDIAAQGMFGTATTNDDGSTTIVMPAKTVTIGEKGWDNGKFLASSLPLEITIPADKPSSISSVADSALPSTTIFDLQGRRLSAPVKGLNIINGQKVRL